MAAKLTYRDAGVDIDAGNRSVQLIKDSVRATYRPEVLGDLGGFGGLFALDVKKFREPVLVSGTDGVGTKLKLAFMLNTLCSHISYSTSNIFISTMPSFSSFIDVVAAG